MSFAKLASVAVVSALVGAMAGGAYVAGRAPPAAPAAAAAADGAAPAGPGAAALPVAGAGRASPHAPAADFQSQRERASRDPAFLQSLLQRYRAAGDPAVRGELLALLTAVGGEDVLRFALSLSASTRPEDERDALALLGAYSLERGEVRQALLDKLQRGGDPQRTAALVAMLVPATLPSEDAAPVIAQLEALAAHADPEVRAQAVLQLAQWDDGARTEDALHRAILDPSPQVRAKAIAGVQGAGLRSDRIKDALLAIAADPRSSAADRGAAAFALQSFRLNRAEYGIWRRAQAQADADSGEGG